MPPKVKAKPSVEELSETALLAALEKRWPGAVRAASDARWAVEKLETGILSLDVRLGGGFARNRYTELFGSYNVGKTNVSFRFIGHQQKLGRRCAFVDVEGTFDPSFAKQAGVNLKELKLTSQQELKQANAVVDYIEVLLRSELYDVIVMDSIAALLPKAEMDADMEAGSMGMEQAKLMSKALRKLTAANKKTALVFINQTRQKVGASAFGKQSITSGGLAMGFYAGTRMEFVRTENMKKATKRVNPNTGVIAKSERISGHRVLVRVEKDKMGTTTGSETTFVYDYDLGGIDPVEDLLYLGRACGVIKKGGSSWWVDGYAEDKKVGRGKFKAYLRADPLLQEEVKERILESNGEADLDSQEDEDE